MEFNFTQEEFEELKAAAPHFETAVKQGTKHNSPKWLDEKVKRIYERIAGPQLVNFNCPSCVFYLYQKCGRLWFQDKIKYAALEAEKKKQEEQQIQLPEVGPIDEEPVSPAPPEPVIESPEPIIEPVHEPEIVEVEEVKEEVKEVPVEKKKRGRKPKNNV
jgi:hypothetical protein